MESWVEDGMKEKRRGGKKGQKVVNRRGRSFVEVLQKTCIPEALFRRKDPTRVSEKNKTNKWQKAEEKRPQKEAT